MSLIFPSLGLLISIRGVNVSLLQGSFNWTVFETFGENPKDADLFDLMTTRALFKEGLPGDYHSIGFCHWNDPGSAPVLDQTFLADGWVLMGIRKDSKRVPKALVNMEFRAYLKGLSADQKKGLNKKMIIQDITDKLLPTIPFTPSIQVAAWHRPSKRLYCEGMGLYDWLVGHLGTLGVKITPAAFLDQHGKAFEMIRSMAFDAIQCPGAPSLVPSQVSFAPTPDLTIQLEDQKISFLGDGDDDAAKAECDSLLTKGGKIVKMKVLTNLEDDNYVLQLNSSNPNVLKFNPGNIRGSIYDKLFHRLEKAVAITYTLENVVRNGANAKV
jgi:hypothetical protein